MFHGAGILTNICLKNDLVWLVVWNMNFIFPYIGNHHPNWLSYFSEGLKPPTSSHVGNTWSIPKGTVPVQSLCIFPETHTGPISQFLRVNISAMVTVIPWLSHPNCTLSNQRFVYRLFSYNVFHYYPVVVPFLFRIFIRMKNIGM